MERPDADSVLRAFDLGEGTLSPTSVALGRVGAVWRLEATSGVWAVKTNTNPDREEGAAASARFNEAAVAAGLAAPAVRRTTDDTVLAYVGRTNVRVLEWVEMEPADPGIDPAAVGALLAGLHRVARPGGWTAENVDPWFCAPVGAAAWDALVAELMRRRAPFAPGFAAHRDELVALEALLEPPADLRWCHRDLFADNVRATPAGGLVVFDFDNSGPESAARELAFVLAEFATTDTGVDGARARELHDAYREAGGPGRLTRPQDFGLVVAVLGHIGEVAARRWLVAADDVERADLAQWSGELTQRPLTRQVIEQLLDALGSPRGDGG